MHSQTVPTTVLTTYVSVGVAAAETGDFAVAKKMFKSALKEIRNEKDDGNLVAVLSNLAWVYYCQKRYRRSREMYERALSLEESGRSIDKARLASILCALSMVALALRNYRQSDLYCARILAMNGADLTTGAAALGQTMIQLAARLHENAKADQACRIYAKASEFIGAGRMRTPLIS